MAQTKQKEQGLVWVTAAVIVVLVVTIIGWSKMKADKDKQTFEPQTIATVTGDEKQPAVASEILGEWADTVSKRATMEISDLGGNDYLLVVHWGSGASQAAVWTMTAHYELGDDYLDCSDVTHKIETYNETGLVDEEIVSSDGTAKFWLENGMLRWEDDAQGPGNGALFEKIATLDDRSSVELSAPAKSAPEDIAVAQVMVEDTIVGYGSDFVLRSVTYDEVASNDPQELAYVNELGAARGGKTYDEVAVFRTDFHTPAHIDGMTAWEEDTDYTWTFYLARSNGGEWEIVTQGY